MKKLFFSSPIFNPPSRRFGELWTFKVKAHFLLTLFIYFINLIYSFLKEYFILKF